MIGRAVGVGIACAPLISALLLTLHHAVHAPTRHTRKARQ